MYALSPATRSWGEDRWDRDALNVDRWATLAHADDERLIFFGVLAVAVEIYCTCD